MIHKQVSYSGGALELLSNYASLLQLNGCVARKAVYGDELDSV